MNKWSKLLTETTNMPRRFVVVTGLRTSFFFIISGTPYYRVSPVKYHKNKKISLWHISARGATALRAPRMHAMVNIVTVGMVYNSPALQKKRQDCQGVYGVRHRHHFEIGYMCFVCLWCLSFFQRFFSSEHLSAKLWVPLHGAACPDTLWSTSGCDTCSVERVPAFICFWGGEVDKTIFLDAAQ